MDDEKLKLLAFEDRWHYVVILCMKRKGILDVQDSAALRDRKVGAKLGLGDRERDEVKRRLIDVSLVDESWQPLGWDKRQFVSDADPTATQRKQKQRDRERHAPVTRDKNPVTDESRTSHTAQSQIQSTDSDSEKNLEREARASRSARATRLPEDFELTPERRAIAETEKADPEREFAQFTDHFRAAPGVKGRKTDWDAAWRNWCRRAPDFKPKPRFATGHPEDTGWRPPEAAR